MISKLEFIFIIAMIVGCTSYIEAKNTVHLDMIVTHDVTARNENFCQFCQDFTTRAINFFKDNETQNEIVSSLHHVCSHLLSLKQQCFLLVDKYASIFTTEIAKVQPKQLCDKVKLCEKMDLVLGVKHDDPCTICHNIVNEFLTKLDDPDEQLEIIQTLLKGCSRIENFSRQCKRLVLEYAPIILVNADKFFQKTDVCAAIHACKAHQVAEVGCEFLAVATA